MITSEAARRGERWPRLGLFAAWLALAVWFASRHVFWRDEVRAFSLALAGDGLPAMLRGVQGEGHPAIWYLLLRVGHMIAPVREVLPAMAVLVAAAAMALLVFRSPLRLGIMCTIGPGNLVELISGINDDHPDIELQIADSDAATLHKRLVDGEIEAAIACFPESADERLHLMPLFREQFMIALPQRHRLASHNAVRAAELNGERYLNRANCEYVNVARELFAEAGTKVNRVYRSERDDWILAMVAAGLGFGFMPQYCLPERSDIVIRPLVEPEIWREIALVTVRGRPHSPALGVLVHQAMQAKWMGVEAIAVQRMRAEAE